MMNKTFQQWVTEGEIIYAEALKDYQNLQAQIDQLEARLADKKNEVNQIAEMIGKPPVEGARRVAAQIVEVETPPLPAMGSVTRALTGRGNIAR